MHRILVQCIDRLTPSCAEVARLASEALDRRLSLKERLAMRLHFTICYYCRRYCDQLRTVREGARSAAEHYGQSCGESLSGNEKERLKQACRKQTG